MTTLSEISSSKTYIFLFLRFSLLLFKQFSDYLLILILPSISTAALSKERGKLNEEEKKNIKGRSSKIKRSPLPSFGNPTSSVFSFRNVKKSIGLPAREMRIDWEGERSPRIFAYSVTQFVVRELDICELFWHCGN